MAETMAHQLDDLRPQEAPYDADAIQVALASYYKCPNLRVDSCKIERVDQPGENFCSNIYRYDVSYRKNELAPVEHENLILKNLLAALATLGSSESYMYEKILPAMQEILDGAYPTPLENAKLSAKCLFIEQAKGREIYLLENLSCLGYQSANRLDGFSYKEAIVCLDKMAQFHASSMILLHQQPQLVEKLKPSHYSNGVEDQFSKILIVDSTFHAANVISDWPEMSHIAAKMRAQLPTAYGKRMIDVVSSKNAAFNTIVHGDIWVNNIMITKNAERVILLDFQNCFVGSPAIDLQYFFHTSLQLDVLLQNRDALLRNYYESFRKVLLACHSPFPVPAFETLLSEMERCLFYAYYGVICELPICCVSKEASQDFTISTFIDPASMMAKRNQIYANDRVHRTFKALLPRFEQQGLLEL